MENNMKKDISLYNGKGKGVDVEKLLLDIKNHASEYGLPQQLYSRIEQALQDNADKKFTLDELEWAVGRAREKGTTEFYKYNLKEIIQYFTKEQPKRDTVMVEYEEYNPAFKNEQDGLYYDGMTAYIKPKLKDGCIVILRG